MSGSRTPTACSPCRAGSSSLDRAGEAAHKVAMAQPTTDILALIARGDAKGLAAALAAGGEANARDRWGVTALMHAAGRGDLAMVEALLKHGAEATRTSDAGNSALMTAAARGHVEIAARLLDAGLDPAHQNKFGMSAFDWAKWPGNAAEVRALLATAGG